MSRQIFAALSLVLLLYTPGCASVATPRTPAQVVYVSQASLAATYGAVADALNAGVITTLQAQDLLGRLDQARLYLSQAQTVAATGSASGAQQWLDLSSAALNVVLTELARAKQ